MRDYFQVCGRSQKSGIITKPYFSMYNDPERLHPWSSSKNLQTAQQAKGCLFHIVLTLIAYLTLRKEFVNLVNFRSFLVLVNFFSL